LEQDAYCVSSALADYWVEHGQHQASADSIKARLKLFNRFLEAEMTSGRIPASLTPDLVDDQLLARFRKWGLADPIVARRKNDAGEWVPGKSRSRSASTVEESIIQLKAVLNHAFKRRRTRYVPPLQHKTRDQVTPQRTYRLSVAALGELLDYSLKGAGNYAGHSDRLLPLRRYLIASICTVGRPDAIFDMSVAPSREQWLSDSGLFALNPAGRVQTKKVRPTLPVVPLLRSWLEATDEWFVCKQISRVDSDTGLEVTEQRGIGSVRSAWNGARAALGMPDGWGPKLIRHSMATILANRRVDLAELRMAMGHEVLGKTTGRYAIFDPGYLGTVKAGIEDVIADLMKAAGPALHAKLTQNSSPAAVSRP
jgi:hypothetical protein